MLPWYNERIEYYGNKGYRFLTEDGKQKTKINCKTRTFAQKEPRTGADARRAGHAVRGASAHRAGLCGGCIGLESDARNFIWPVRLRQLRAGRGGVLSGHFVYPRRGPDRTGVQADAGPDLRQRHGDRVLGHPRQHSGRADGGRVLSERRRCVAGRRRDRCAAGRQSAAALRASGGKPRDGRAGLVRQPVHL